MHAGPPVAIDCFAGAGGLALGLRDAGFSVRAAFDASPFAVATYQHNLGPHIVEARAEDLCGLDLLRLSGYDGWDCALVAGGPPCQGFSVQRRGEDEDERNTLILDFLRLVRDIGPQMFLMENVSAIRGKRGDALLERFFEDARRAGYHVSVAVLDAADYGVAQHRRRAFVVGERDDCPPAFVFPEPTHREGTWRTVRHAIGDLPSPMAAPEEAAQYPNHEADQISDINRLRISFVPPGGGREHIPEHLRLPCHRVSVEKAGHRNVYGRLHWDHPAGTITTKCNSFTRGKFAHPAEDRNITMREAARLQGFPDDFVFLGGRVPVAHQIGNAVPPPLALALGNAILETLRRREKGVPAEVAGQLSFFL